MSCAEVSKHTHVYCKYIADDRQAERNQGAQWTLKRFPPTKRADTHKSMRRVMNVSRATPTRIASKLASDTIKRGNQIYIYIRVRIHELNTYCMCMYI